MDLARDVLDKQMVDLDGRKLGRVDGLVLRLRRGGPPEVAAVLCGGAVLARRLGPRWVAALFRFFGRFRPRGVPDEVRIPFSRVQRVGIEVGLDVDAEHADTLAWERWLAQHVVGRVPGGGGR